jgi:hypothetical protein
MSGGRTELETEESLLEKPKVIKAKIFVLKKFYRGNCNNGGLIVPKSKREG